jgi:hypothetical protein
VTKFFATLLVAFSVGPLGLGACGGAANEKPAVATRPASASAGPAWAQTGDRSDANGSLFVCEGDGATEEAALAAAQAICNDKVCKLCGVEVESVVQTTETLKGVSMQRKVVERCRRFRKGEPKVRQKTTDCGAQGCATWLSVEFSKEDEKNECSAYAAEHFADPAECQRLIDAFRSTQGRSAPSFRQRAQLLDDALAACKDIDVRPTPLVDALQQKLIAGMESFEFTPAKQLERLEEPFFDSTWYHSREEMMRDRQAGDAYLTTYGPLVEQIGETPTLTDRIKLVRDYVFNRAQVFDVIEAAEADTLDSASGIARLLAALRAAPPGAQYGSPDVHFAGLYRLRQVRADIGGITQFYRQAYPPESLTWERGIPLAVLFVKDHHVDEVEWKYIFDLHRGHPCPVCVLTLLGTPDHGGSQVRDARFFAVLDHDLALARRPGDRKRIVAELIPRDPQFTLHIRTRLPKDLQSALDWDFFDRRLDEAEAADDLAAVRQILPLLAATVSGEEIDRSTCSGLADRLGLLGRKAALVEAPPPSLDERICACLTGPMAHEGTRVLSNKSELYDYALGKRLPCVQSR